LASSNWKRSLAVSFVGELLTMIAFNSLGPIMPLYIQRVGNLTVEKAAFWTGVSAGGQGILMFLISPIWGLIADRFGRKPMVLRAMFGGAIILSLVGFAPNLYVLMALLWLQGLILGTVPAMTALIGSIVPRERMSFAMGIIMLAIFSGQTLGPVCGGYIADHLGYHATFYMAGFFLFAASTSVLVLLREDFHKPPQEKTNSIRSMFRLAASNQMLPVLTILCSLSIAQSMANPMIPLRVSQINTIGNTPTVSGVILSLMGLTAAVSSLVFGQIGIRISLPKIMAFCCFIIGLLYFPLSWSGTIVMLATFLILTGLFQGGIATSTNSIVGLSVTQEQQGIAFGLSQSANSLGGGLGPIIGGSLAAVAGLQPIFSVAAGVFMISGFLTTRLLFKRSTA
jgi:MFS transporter, DHA1 family, multidrug resistance protein